MKSGLITVHRTVRSDRSSHESLLFPDRTVLDVKKTTKMNSSKFSRSDRTVRSGFQNLGCMYAAIINIKYIYLYILYICFLGLCNNYVPQAASPRGPNGAN